jgi:hypothetical protein
MNGRTGFPALHIAPGHSDLDVALLETPTPFSSTVAKRVSRLGQQLTGLSLFRQARVRVFFQPRVQLHHGVGGLLYGL